MSSDYLHKSFQWSKFRWEWIVAVPESPRQCLVDVFRFWMAAKIINEFKFKENDFFFQKFASIWIYIGSHGEHIPPLPLWLTFRQGERMLRPRFVDYSIINFQYIVAGWYWQRGNCDRFPWFFTTFNFLGPFLCQKVSKSLELLLKPSETYKGAFWCCPKIAKKRPKLDFLSPWTGFAPADAFSPHKGRFLGQFVALLQEVSIVPQHSKAFILFIFPKK